MAKLQQHMTERDIECCSNCADPTGKAGAGEDSIFWLDGQIGPLCEECSHKLRDEVLEDCGVNEVQIDWTQRHLAMARRALIAIRDESTDSLPTYRQVVALAGCVQRKATEMIAYLDANKRDRGQ